MDDNVIEEIRNYHQQAELAGFKLVSGPVYCTHVARLLEKIDRLEKKVNDAYARGRQDGVKATQGGEFRLHEGR